MGKLDPRMRAWLIGCLLLMIAQAAFARPPSPQSWQPGIDRLVADDSAHPPPQQGVLLVGISSIRMWTTLAADFPGVPVIDRGFGGSAIADTTYYAHPGLAASPVAARISMVAGRAILLANFFGRCKARRSSVTTASAVAAGDWRSAFDPVAVARRRAPAKGTLA